MTSTAAAARVAPVRALGRAANSRGSARGLGGVSAFSNNARRAAFARRAVAPAPARRASSLRINAVAENRAASAEGDANLVVSVDGSSDPAQTIISVRATNRPGILQQMKSTLEDLGLNVEKTEVDMDGDLTNDTFYVTDDNGSRVDDPYDLANIEQVITVVLNAHFLKSSGAPRPADKDPTNLMPDGSKPKQKDLLYSLMDNYIKNDTLSVQNSIVNHVEYTLARSRYRFDDFEAYQVRHPSSILPPLFLAIESAFHFPCFPKRPAVESPARTLTTSSLVPRKATSLSVRDRLIESWNDTQQYFREQDPKRVYYLSMEFLMGRSLTNSLYNLEIKGTFHEALKQLGYSLEDLVEKERDAALGNGGLGRLAACFLDSMASENLPAWGYGIRYQYGMFRQELHEGFQHENPDYWLNFGNPWEIERPGIAYPIKFYGHVTIHDVDGRQAFRWESGEEVTAVAYDTPIPGWNTPNTINMRLWSAKPSREFDLESFNTGDYVQAILAKQRAETISAVLYPDDRTYQGKELRLKQQFFMVSATLQDIIRRYLVTHKDDSFDHFPEKVALQLNDTHPTIGVPELMRLLMDEHGLGWTKSWDITTRVFSFTNHTVLPEALEKWPVELVENVLPRHMQIIYDINWRFTQELRGIMGDDYDRIGRMSIIEEGEGFEKSVRMAHLALVASHTVNGVAAIHSELIKTTIFKEFYDLMPEKFQNKTNGVTQRRLLEFCNPALSSLISETLGTDAWVKELDLLQGLRVHADDPAFQEKWAAIKTENKRKLADLIKEKTGVTVPTNALFDIQVKRIHEYKRQLLNVFAIIHRYNALKEMTPAERKQQVPRVCIVGGMAKRIIKLVSAVGDTVNKDPDIGDLLKVVFIPDYNVSSAEVIIPGAELSQHISTAGTEASGTSNMKFAMNGCLIIGTMDGANVEIAEEIGEENMFIFGARADVVPSLRREREHFNVPEGFYKIVDQIRSGVFGWSDFFNPVCDAVCGGADYYLLANDFESYIDAQRRVDEAYADQARWNRMSILSVAGSGKFSSDRTIREYAEDIWDVKPCRRPMSKSSAPAKKPFGSAEKM
jgi:starch phosphorylase